MDFLPCTFSFLNANATPAPQGQRILTLNHSGMFEPQLALLPGHTGFSPSQVGPAPTLGCWLPSKTSQQQLPSAVTAGKDPPPTTSSPSLNQSSRLTIPTPHPSSRGTHSVLNYVSILVRWDFCISRAFHFLIFKVALQVSSFWICFLLFQIHVVLLKVCLTVYLFPLGLPKQLVGWPSFECSTLLPLHWVQPLLQGQHP